MLIIVIALVCVGLVLWIQDGWIKTYTITGTVKDKWVDYSGDSSCYLIRLTDNKMLEVDTNIFHTWSNPDLVFGDIKIGETYKFTCWGWEIVVPGFCYYYPYVLKAEHV